MVENGRDPKPVPRCPDCHRRMFPMRLGFYCGCLGHDSDIMEWDLAEVLGYDVSAKEGFSGAQEQKGH